MVEKRTGIPPTMIVTEIVRYVFDKAGLFELVGARRRE